jgi:hypothetical protein
MSMPTVGESFVRFGTLASHQRGRQISLKVAGRRKLLDIYCPMLAAGVGSFLGETQQSRTFVLEMEPYTATTKPEREWTTAGEEDIANLNARYSFLRHWAAKVKLDLKLTIPSEILRRFADNVRGLLAVADACGPEWSRRAREAIMVLFAKELAERPEIVMLRHGLLIFETLGVDTIKSTLFNRELKRLDLPDAKLWVRYCGASGLEGFPHPIELYEQTFLLKKVGIVSEQIRPPAGKQFRGYRKAWFEEAWAEHGSRSPDDTGSARGRQRLIGGSN